MNPHDQSKLFLVCFLFMCVASKEKEDKSTASPETSTCVKGFYRF